MIILDTNILKQVSLRGPEAELLRTIRASEAERVATPWIALEERAAQQALLYAEKHKRALAELDALAKASPWETIHRPRMATPETVRSHWRDRYQEVAEVLRTSPQAYEEALFREANLLAPCKPISNGDHKTGARDAAIWLTAVEYAKDHPDEIVYFVSADRDFGDGESLPAQMAKDLEHIADRFVRFSSLADVLTKFATEVTVDDQAVRNVLAAEIARRTVAEAVHQEAELHRLSGLVIHEDDDETSHISFRSWSCGPAVALGGVRDVRAHEINRNTWCTATARWLLASHTRIPDASGIISCAWETRVLLRPDAPDEGVTITRRQRIEPITPADRPYLPALEHSHEEPSPAEPLSLQERQALHLLLTLRQRGSENDFALLRAIAQNLASHRPPETSP